MLRAIHIAWPNWAFLITLKSSLSRLEKRDLGLDTRRLPCRCHPRSLRVITSLARSADDRHYDAAAKRGEEGGPSLLLPCRLCNTRCVDRPSLSPRPKSFLQIFSLPGFTAFQSIHPSWHHAKGWKCIPAEVESVRDFSHSHIPRTSSSCKWWMELLLMPFFYLCRSGFNLQADIWICMYRVTTINMNRKGRIGRAEWCCPFCQFNPFPAHVYCSHPVDQTSSTPIGNDMDGGREDISRLPHCLFPRFHLTSSEVKCDNKPWNLFFRWSTTL